MESSGLHWETHCVSDLGEKVARQWGYHLPMPHANYGVYRKYTKRIRVHAPTDLRPTELVLRLIEQLDCENSWPLVTMSRNGVGLG